VRDTGPHRERGDQWHDSGSDFPQNHFSVSNLHQASSNRERGARRISFPIGVYIRDVIQKTVTSE
jgi:hypothetical protein